MRPRRDGSRDARLQTVLLMAQEALAPGPPAWGVALVDEHREPAAVLVASNSSAVEREGHACDAAAPGHRPAGRRRRPSTGAVRTAAPGRRRRSRSRRMAPSTP